MSERIFYAKETFLYQALRFRLPSGDLGKEVFAMSQIRATLKHTRYVMGSLTAVLFAACAGSS